MLIDIRKDILPGTQFGPPDEAGAMELAKKAANLGVTHIIVTPPHTGEPFRVDTNKIETTVHRMNDMIKRDRIPLSLFSGMKITLHDKLLEDLQDNWISLANTGKYMFIELPEDRIPQNTMTIFFELQLRGIIPILANPERNAFIRSHPNWLFEVVRRGALVQLNASSITGAHGKALQRFSMKLCKRNLVHIIASGSQEFNKKSVSLQSAYTHIRKKDSMEYELYLKRNLKHVLEGIEFHTYPPIPFN